VSLIRLTIFTAESQKRQLIAPRWNPAFSWSTPTDFHWANKAVSSKGRFKLQGMLWLGSQEAGMPGCKKARLLILSAESGLGFFSFLRKLKKDPEDPVDPVKNNK
jgi:hypothetical protein